MNGRRNGSVWVGSPCDDVITPGPKIRVVKGGPGNDFIYGGSGGDTLLGEGGNDVLVGERDNDTLRGGPGNDRLVGGIGDDRLFGDDGNDQLEGGQGLDFMSGGDDNDVLKGGGTKDELVPGPGEQDTITYADATTPGFSNAAGFNNWENADGFPSDPDGRGIYVDLSVADENGVRGGIPIYAGTQKDFIGYRKCQKPSNPNAPPTCKNISDRSEVERIVGSPYADYIKDAPSNDLYIDGGPGPDFIEGNGGTDSLLGGSELDYIIASSGSTVDGGSELANCAGFAGTNCTSTTVNEVAGKAPGQIRVGSVQTGPDSGIRFTDYYMTGSNLSDNLKVYFGSDPARVIFAAQDADTRAALTASSVVAGETCAFRAKGDPDTSSKQRVVCTPPNGVGSVVVDGRASRDILSIPGFPRAVHVYVLGGLGPDKLNGGRWGDSIVDGDFGDPNSSKETLSGGAGDDLVVTGGGFDHAWGGPGNDLMMNGAFCAAGGHRVQGGGKGSDNLQFAQIQRQTTQPGFVADLAAGTLGQRGGNTNCTDIAGFEDIEGSFWNDTLLGNDADNLLIGRGGEDIMRGRGGNDRLYAYDRLPDDVIDCGGSTVGNPQRVRAVVDRSADWGAPNNIPGVVENCGPKRPKFRADHIYLSAPLDDSEIGTDDLFPDANAEAFFRLNEASGTRSYNWATDVGDLTEDGTYTSLGTGTDGITFEAEAAVMPDTAIALDGVEGYATLTNKYDPANFDTEGWVATLWTKLDSTGPDTQTLLEQGGPSNGYRLFKDDDDRLVFETRNGLSRAVVSTFDPIDMDVWHHIALTLSDNSMALFVDGREYRIGYAESAGESVWPTPSISAQLRLGMNTAANHPAKGIFDEVAIYSGEVSSDDLILDVSQGAGELAPFLIEPQVVVLDADSDGIIDSHDNCPADYNPGQEDEDGNGIGDACDAPLDSDGDEVPDSTDNCPDVWNEDQADVDSDGIGDECEDTDP